MPFYHVPYAIIFTLLHWYIWKRLIKDSTRPGRLRQVLTVLWIVLDLFMVAALLLGTFVPPSIGQWFAWPGWIWFGLFVYILLTALVLEIPRLALLGWIRRDPKFPPPPKKKKKKKTAPEDVDNTEEPADEPAAEPAEPPRGVSRRMLLARGTAAIVGVTAVGAVGYGVPTAMGAPDIKQVRIALRRLDPRAAGCRIALVSDIHLSALLGRSFTQRVVDTINSQRPDLIAVCGDLMDGSLQNLAAATEPLRELRATQGSFYVTGNHEYYYAYAEWIDHVRTLGIRPLLNERVTITHNGGAFELAGLTDPEAERAEAEQPDVAKALRGWDRQRSVVMLSHQPRNLDEARAEGVDLVLSGHTHGGQLWPFTAIVSGTQVSVTGLSQHGDTQLYITNGAGFWGPPVRVGARPDITIVELATA
ncbi:metallophosphoesterase [Amycolatopsis nigrescens]|uniref:metallophosphoesterase n=1 Tax=Amycolatopsis nigrescens TaxID=381445 RepID=UPI00037337E3|nr:metallophosphoesterase [Amycolatopsis nigrescens]